MPTFEEYVAEWNDIAGQKAQLEKQLAPLRKKEMEMRKEIVKGLVAAMGDKVKEGVNKFEMSDGSTLKFNYKLTRTIDQGMLSAVKEEYSALNSAVVPFDDLLRVKHELDKKNYDKLSDTALMVFQKLITTKEAAPELTIE